MNIFVGRDSKTLQVILFLMMISWMPLYGAAVHESQTSATDIPSQQEVIDAFYASKLPDMHPKFVAAACLAIRQDPKKGTDFLWQRYQEDQIVALTQKTQVQSETLKFIENKCRLFSKTYSSHHFWQQYTPETVRDAVTEVFDDEDVTAQDILDKFASDAKSLSGGYQSVFEILIAASEKPVSAMVLKMFIGCELVQEYSRFDKAVTTYAKICALDEKSILKLQSIARLLACMREGHKDKFVPYLFCAAVKMAEQNVRVSAEKWTSSKQFEAVMNAYACLEYAVGPQWRESKQNADHLRPFIARLAMSDVFMNRSFLPQTYGGAVTYQVMQSFFKDQLEEREQQKRKVAAQRQHDEERKKQEVEHKKRLEGLTVKAGELLKNHKPSYHLRHRYFKKLQEFAVMHKREKDAAIFEQKAIQAHQKQRFDAWCTYAQLISKQKASAKARKQAIAQECCQRVDRALLCRSFATLIRFTQERRNIDSSQNSTNDDFSSTGTQPTVMPVIPERAPIRQQSRVPRAFLGADFDIRSQRSGDLPADCDSALYWDSSPFDALYSWYAFNGNQTFGQFMEPCFMCWNCGQSNYLQPDYSSCVPSGNNFDGFYGQPDNNLNQWLFDPERGYYWIDSFGQYNYYVEPLAPAHQASPEGISSSTVVAKRIQHQPYAKRAFTKQIQNP